MVYLCVPFYNDKSNGIVLCYEFIKILNKAGIEAKILCVEDERYDVALPDEIKQYYISKAVVPQKIADDDVIIYLDTVDKNAPKAKNVIYWLLNRPGALTENGRKIKSDDFLLAYSNLVHQELPQMFMLRDDRKQLTRVRESTIRRKDTVSVYFGKVHLDQVLEKNMVLKRLIAQYKKINIITRFVPNKKEQMLRNLSQSDLLISYDPLSNINYEATLLGTPVLMMDDAYDLKYTAYNAGNYGLAFDESEIEECKKEVHLAFETYNKHLEGQSEYVVKTFKWALEQLKLIHTKPEALRQNKEFNEKIKKDFLEFQNCIKKPFVNIDLPESIPAETWEILHLGGGENLEFETEQQTSTDTTAKTLRDKLYLKVKPKWAYAMYRKPPANLESKELRFLLFRRMTLWFKRLRIKPKWADAMYGKQSGDLKPKELLYLLFRRMALQFKK